MKAILLVKVSTEAQDFTEQEREIYQMATEAKASGFLRIPKREAKYS